MLVAEGGRGFTRGFTAVLGREVGGAGGSSGTLNLSFFSSNYVVPLYHGY